MVHSSDMIGYFSWRQQGRASLPALQQKNVTAATRLTFILSFYFLEAYFFCNCWTQQMIESFRKEALRMERPTSADDEQTGLNAVFKIFNTCFVIFPASYSIQSRCTIFSLPLFAVEIMTRQKFHDLVAHTLESFELGRTIEISIGIPASIKRDNPDVIAG